METLGECGCSRGCCSPVHVRYTCSWQHPVLNYQELPCISSVEICPQVWESWSSGQCPYSSGKRESISSSSTRYFLLIKNAHHWDEISLMMYRYSSLFGRSTSVLYCGILHQLLSIPFQSIPARINFKEVDYSTLGIEYNLYNGYSELVIACFFRKCVSLCQEVESTLAWRYRSISIGVLCMFSRKHFKSLLDLIANSTFTWVKYQYWYQVMIKKISLSINRAVYLKGGPLNQWVIPKA